MPLGGNEVTFVAGQLTVAWSNLFARTEGAGGLQPHGIREAVAATYDSFAAAIQASDHGFLERQMAEGRHR